MQSSALATWATIIPIISFAVTLLGILVFICTSWMRLRDDVESIDSRLGRIEEYFELSPKTGKKGR